MADTPEKRTKLDRNLVALRATSEQCEAAEWFWTREIWARHGVRDPILDATPSRYNNAGQEEAQGDELTWRLSRADTYAILRTFYDRNGWGYWSLAYSFLVEQKSFQEIGAAYYSNLKKTQQYEHGRRMCMDLLERLVIWLADYRKKRRKTASRTTDGHPWPSSPRAVIVESC
ncbi:hypothetical protein CO583_01805 [Parasaccharibacter sp. TMW2.1882]|uniref:hypothetical protein n=1 Tax=Parasaccharibacter sp. TMW2.1882 TaxID=2039286 RepID=UPI0020131C30|nr:hypothetical protein [Parasaccharibacter sp. TMW2.1882]MCL1496245.1 hypothetical protein [Parasaccharibacter sp. TMW2.1882]